MGGGTRGDGGAEEVERDPSARTDAVQPSKQPRRTQFATLPPHNPPPPQLPSVLHQQNGQITEDPHTTLSVNPFGPAGAAVTPNSLSNEVRLLKGRARELREEGIRIKKVQSGTRKRHRGAGSAEGKNDTEEDGQAHDTITVATNGPTEKRKRSRAIRETS